MLELNNQSKDQWQKIKDDENEVITDIALRKLYLVILVCFFLMIAEIIGGLMAQSLAIMTDAAHLMADMTGFFISILAMYLTKKQKNDNYNYGYSRAEVIGTLLSISIIWILTFWLVYEAIGRLLDQSFIIDSKIMLITSIFGLLSNLVMVKVLHGNGNCPHGGHGHSHGFGGGNGQSHVGHGNSHGEPCNHASHNHSQAGHDDHFHFKKEKSNYKLQHSSKDNDENCSQAQGKTNENKQSNHDGHGHKHNENCKHAHENNNSNYHVHKNHQNHEKCKHGHSHGHNLVNINHSDGYGYSRKDSEDESFNKIEYHDQETQINLQNITELDHENALLRGHQQQQQCELEYKRKIEENINIRAAQIHILGDIIQSVGVIIAAIFISVNPENKLADPICTLLFSVLVMWTTKGVVQECIAILMQKNPKNHDIDNIIQNLSRSKGVKEVKNVQVWSLSTGKYVLTAHIVSENPQQTLELASQLCNKINLFSYTFQVFIQNIIKIEDWNSIEIKKNLQEIQTEL